MELKELFMYVRKELRSADMFAREAVKHKVEYPELSSVYHRIASDKMVHAEMLAAQARHMADKHHMMDAWDVEDYMIKHDMADIRRCLESHK